jgi:hypothetical protein
MNLGGGGFGRHFPFCDLGGITRQGAAKPRVSRDSRRPMFGIGCVLKCALVTIITVDSGPPLWDKLPVGDTTAGESNMTGRGAGLPEIN